MKIGFSFGRCIRDIVKGEVAIDEVVVIVSGTMIERDRIEGVVDDYLFRNDYLYGLERDACLTVAYQLWDAGLVHQPRMFGQYRTAVKESCVWADLFPAGNTEDPMVKDAWNEYRALLGLSGNKADVDEEQKKYNWGSH